MSNIQLRLPLGLGQRLHDAVFASRGHEVVAFCLVSHAAIERENVLLVHDLHLLDEQHYVDDPAHGAAWRGTSMLPIIEVAMSKALGIVLVHAHDFPGPARISADDLASASRLVPMFQARVPGRPHGSIVLARGSAAGLVALPGQPARAVDLVRVRWMGKAIVNWTAADDESARPDEVFDRQALVVGRQAALSGARVVVAGLSGGGSHMVQQLAHAGVGTIVGVDPDVAEGTNLHRNVGMRARDGRVSKPKIEVMKRMVRTIGTGTRFVGIDAAVPEPRAIKAVQTADVVVGCVDSLHARADLQEITWRNVIPYVDLGVTVRALKGTASEPRVAIGGNVFVFIPGGFCAWCCGFISEEKLRAERDGHQDRSYFQNRKGAAQVVSLNGTVASQATTEVIQLLTGFRGSSFRLQDLLLPDGRQRGAFKLDGLRGTLEEWGAMRRPDCRFCGETLAAGTVLWRTAA